MQTHSQKISLRRFLIFLACPVIACGVAFFVCYGRNIAWALFSLTRTQHVPLTIASLNATPQDEEFLRCTFMNVEFDVPASMARNASIWKGSDGARWLLLTDQRRKIRIPLTSGRAQRTIYGVIPPTIENFTNTELLAHLYERGTSDFSFGMNKAQLQEHNWVMNYRDLLAYDLHLKNMTFATHEDFQVLLLSATASPSIRRASNSLAYANWSLADHTNGGMVYFFDDAVGDSGWAVRSAMSLRRPSKPKIANDDEFERRVAEATDDELLKMLEVVSTTE